jgi:hypothetical protein
MEQEITVLTLQDRERWRAAHRDGGLPSQSWEYAFGLSAAGGDPKLAVVEAGGARMLLPFVEQSWGGATDIATILGMSGASIAPPSPAPLTLWSKFAASQGWVAGYIQLAVTLALNVADLGDPVAINNTTFLLPLQRGDILPLVSRTIRRKIKAACEEAPTLIEDPTLLGPQLARLYGETMQRVGASPHYRFPMLTLDRWLADPASVVLGAELSGEIESVYVFRVAGDYAEALITGSTERGRRLVPWLVWRGAQRLQRLGVVCLDLGGTPRTGDGLYQFKEKFRGLPRPIRAVHQVYDHRRFDELCRIAGSTPTRWFPPYRAAPFVDMAWPTS